MSLFVSACEKCCCSPIFFSSRVANNVACGCTVWGGELFSDLGTVCRHRWWEKALLRGELLGR